MLVRLWTLLFLGLLPLARARSLPSKTAIGRVRAAAAPAIPTATLLSDFKKGNTSSQWAEGHPKVWGSEEAKYEFAFLSAESIFSGTVSPDEKFVVMANISSVKIIDLDTKALVSTFKLNSFGEADRVFMQAARGGGYDLFISTTDYESTRNDTTVRIQISESGTPKEEQMLYPGRLSSFDKTPFSKDGRRLLTQTWPKVTSAALTIVYDLDKLGSSMALAGHSDWVTSAAFSPDNKYISTTGLDGYAKVWDATAGTIIHTFGPNSGHNWLNNFSPNGKYYLVSNGGARGAPSTVSIWPVANFSAEPIVLTPYANWVRSVSWTSDSELLALGSYGVIHIYSMKEQKIVQKWEMENQSSYEVWELTWIENELGRKLTYRVTSGLEMYDFERNLKYRWGPDYLDRYGEASGDSTTIVKRKGWIGGVDADRTMRFYKFLI